MKRLLIIFYFFVFISQAFTQWFSCYLNNGWQFRRVGDATWFPATIPGTVQSDLLANKLIPDPYFGDNEKKIQWIENEDWEYKNEFYDTSFVLHYIMRGPNVEIIFLGLDTYADVYLNNQLILNANNMFRSWTIDIKSFVVKGKNTLRIIFKSPIKIIDSLKKNSLSLPGDNYSLTRKSAYHFGWDWGPRFVTSGIWKNIIIRNWKDYKFKNVKIEQNSISKEKADLTAVLTIKTNKSAALQAYIVNRNNPFDFVLMGDTLINKIIQTDSGDNVIKINFSIKKPELWFSHDLGYQKLYNIDISLMDKNNDKQYILSRIGLRTIELVREKDSIGESFYFKLNGKPIFIKGANYIPSETFLVPADTFPSAKKEKYLKIIRNAVRSNINMLRVWGGGIYEDDEFYKQCDEKGILVWQDFMFACAMYPGDSSFVNNVQQEAIENIQRLNNHPCIALWCSNNEIDEGWHNWGWQKQFGYSSEDSAKIWNDYLKLFHEILPSVVNEYALVKNYIPSSPKIGWGHPESMTEGDSHYWGVWWGMEPFDVYKTKVPRFMSEYGFQGFPDIKTIESFTNPWDRYLYSDVMKSHQKHPTGYETIQKYLEKEYRQPKDFESYVYVSQLLQAYGIKTAIEAQRRAKPYCMGTLYWQLNDCWPVVSWSGIDYCGRWKALQYFVKDAYKDILVSVNEEGDNIRIYIVSDRLTDTKGRLKIKLLDFSGKVFSKFSEEVLVAQNSSEVYFSFDKKELLSGIDRNETMLSVLFEVPENHTGVYGANYYFVPPNELNLPQLNINFSIETDNKGKKLVLSSDKLAKNIYISIPGAEVRFDINYFDMLPDETYNTYFVNSLPEVTKEDIRIKSLVNSYQ